MGSNAAAAHHFVSLPSRMISRRLGLGLAVWELRREAQPESLRAAAGGKRKKKGSERGGRWVMVESNRAADALLLFIITLPSWRKWMDGSYDAASIIMMSTKCHPSMFIYTLVKKKKKLPLC